MNLVIDIGNSRTKCAIFSGEEMVDTFSYPDFTVSHLEMLASRYHSLQKVIISSVSDTDPTIGYYLENKFNIYLKLDSETPVPILNSYKTPITLGLDRLAAAVQISYFPARTCWSLMLVRP